MKSYANALRTKKKKLYSEAVRTKKKKKLSPFMLSKTILKFKKGLKKSKEKGSKHPPKIFLIQGHSGACFLKDMDKQINDGTLKPIRFLEKAAKKYTKQRHQLQTDATNLREYNIGRLRCHNFINHKNRRPASYFCPECLDESKGKRYLWCDECNSALHDTDLYGAELHKPIKYDTRVDLGGRLDDSSHVKVLMTQSPGRAGLIKTGFIMIEEYVSKYKKLLETLVKTDVKDIKSINKQIDELNKVTNRINPEFAKKKMTHKNKTDTDFRLYPRVNEEIIKGKKIKRFIPGPVDVMINFSVNPYVDQLNARHWPLGVFNLDDFTSTMLPSDFIYEFLFNDTDYSIRNFFNIIKGHSSPGSVDLTKKKLRRGMLLEIDNVLMREKKINPLAEEDKEMLEELLNLKQDPMKKNMKNRSVNRYNKLIYDTLLWDSRTNKLATSASIKDIISKILEYEENIVYSGGSRPDILFIFNQCRTTKTDFDDVPLGDIFNHTQDPRTSPFYSARRQNSEEAV